jgi:DnaJ domain
MSWGVDIDKTRRDIRETFAKWNIKQGDYEIAWDDEGRERRVMPSRRGVKVRYFRNKVWQEVSCLNFGTKSENLRQCFFLIDRLRIAERHGVQYQGLTYTKEVVNKNPVDTEKERRETLLEAYDILGASPDDPTSLIQDLYKKKCLYYHPDKGGTDEKFKRLQRAYELICQSRNVHT